MICINYCLLFFNTLYPPRNIHVDLKMRSEMKRRSQHAGEEEDEDDEEEEDGQDVTDRRINSSSIKAVEVERYEAAEGASF